MKSLGLMFARNYVSDGTCHINRPNCLMVKISVSETALTKISRNLGTVFGVLLGSALPFL